MSFKKLDIDEKIILRNRIPLLIKDQNWIRLFGSTRDKNIQNARNELIELLEEEKKLKRKRIILEKEKKNAIKMILDISDAINNEQKIETVELLDEYKKEIEYINEELDEIIFQIETIPQKINQSNFNLLKATVYVGYKELKDRERRLNETIDELDKLRERLKYLINERYDCEELIDSTYSFLHDMLGSEEMEKLDEKIL